MITALLAKPAVGGALRLIGKLWWAIPILGLTIALMITRGTLSATKTRLSQTQAAFDKTVSNYRLAAEQRKSSDLANVQRVSAEQSEITQETLDGYQANLARLRADFARRVRDATKGNIRIPSGTNLPETCPAPCRADAGAGEAKLPLKDALIASEQAEQLIALQAWVRAVSAIDVNGTVPAN